MTPHTSSYSYTLWESHEYFDSDADDENGLDIQVRENAGRHKTLYATPLKRPEKISLKNPSEF